MLDGGARLLGRILPIGRGWRLAAIGGATLDLLAGTTRRAIEVATREARA